MVVSSSPSQRPSSLSIVLSQQPLKPLVPNCCVEFAVATTQKPLEARAPNWFVPSASKAPCPKFLSSLPSQRPNSHSSPVPQIGLSQQPLKPLVQNCYRVCRRNDPSAPQAPCPVLFCQVRKPLVPYCFVKFAVATTHSLKSPAASQVPGDEPSSGPFGLSTSGSTLAPSTIPSYFERLVNIVSLISSERCSYISSDPSGFAYIWMEVGP